jgi:hypothetical protein
MGMLDQEMMFSDGQTVTTVGDTPSTNVYDTAGGTTAILNNGQGDNALTGENLWLNIRASSAVTSGGAATVQGVFQNSNDNVTWVDVLAGQAVPVANLTGPTDLLITHPPATQFPGTLRYWRTVIRVGGAALTAGTFDSYVSNTIQRNIPRASGFNATGI